MNEIDKLSVCPKCYSRHWKKEMSRGLTITSDKHGHKTRRLDNDAGMPTYFICLDCGHEVDSV